MTVSVKSDQVFLLSAHDEQALERRAAQLANFINEAAPSLDDLAYSLERGRATLRQRAALIVPEGQDSAEAFRTLGPNCVQGQSTHGTPHVAWLFPGQGAQFRGMARQLYDKQPVFRAHFDACANVLDKRLPCSLGELIFREEETHSGKHGTDERLNQTAFTQPALFAIELCLAHTLLHHGAKPDVLVGHSLGELAAACFAGVFELEAGLMLAYERGRLMQSMPSGSMLAVRASLSEIEPHLNEELHIAARNAPSAVVISGTHAAIDRLEAQIGELYACRRLHTSHAFHSAMMDPIVDPFVALVDAAAPKPPRYPLISTLTGKLLSDEEATSSQYWARQLRYAVDFASAAASLLVDDPQNLVLLEVGPGTTLLSATAQQRSIGRAHAAIETLGHPKHARDANEAFLLALGRLWIAGATVDWNTVYAGRSKKLLRLPTYPFAKRRYWVDAPSKESTSTSLLLPGQQVSADAGSSIEAQVTSLVSARLGEQLDETDRRRTFVELGFDSLALSQLAGRIRERFGIRLRHRVLFETANTPLKLADHLVSVGANAAVKQETHTAASPATGPFELTPGQRELWVQSRTSDAANQCYVQCRRIHIAGPLDPHVMQQAFDAIVARHPALRTVFSPDGTAFSFGSTAFSFGSTAFSFSSTEQGSGATPTFFYRDISQLDADERDRIIETTDRTEGGRTFDLRTGPLFFARLLRLGSEHHELWLNAHHIVYDGRTSALIATELAEIYTSLIEGRAPALEPATDFSWYVERLKQEDHARDLAFWSTQFQSLPELLDLPVDRPRAPQRSFEGSTRYLQLELGLFPRVLALAEQAQTSAFTVLLACYQVLLARLSGQDDVTVGIPFQSPGVEEVRSLAGHTVNLLPLRTLVSSTSSFRSVLSAVHDTVLNARDHSSVTFSELLAALPVEREAGRLPLLETMFNVSRKLDDLQFGQARGALGYVDKQAIQYDFFVNVVPRGENLLLVCDYVTASYDGATIDRWLSYYLRIVEQVCANVEIEVGALELLTDVERTQQLEQRPAATPFDRHANCAQAFVETADKFADAPALHVADETWSYKQLKRRAFQVAHLLREHGVARGSRVAVCLPRTADLVASLLGTWLTGAAYVPVDPHFPPDRIQMILEEAAPTVVVSTQALRANLSRQAAGQPATFIALDEHALEELEAKIDGEGDDLAYIIFTSGSTGRPKGVQIPHRCLTNFLDSMRQEPGLTEDDRLLALTTISFDIAALELFLPLTTGASVDLAPYEMSLDPKAIAARLKQTQATVMQATPATWRMMIDSGWQGSSNLRMFCGGEALPKPLAEELLSRGAQLWNLYGPTETTIWSTLARVEAGKEIELGKPIANTSVYVVDERGRLQLPGVTGELWIGGEGVGLGYWKNPTLTAEKFVKDPFAPQPNARAYRTGDLVRMAPNGRIQFLGRMDHQVKVRGFRIELAEIENALLSAQNVQQAVVVARPNPHGENQLLAYVIGESKKPAAGALRAHLEQTLPSYMIPAHFVVLDAFPLTPNGKVDRKALPAPQESFSSHESGSSQSVKDRAPRSPAEEILQQIWQEVLGVNAPGIHDNFYNLGGSSLGAVRIVDAAHAAGLDVSPLQFFQTPTIAGLAEASTTRSVPGADASLVVLREGTDEGARAPLFLVHSTPGDVVGYAQLLRALPPGRAVYGFQSLGLVDPTRTHRSIEEMAAHYVSVMKTVYPSGPYHIGGWCFGGNVAMEMARIVHQQGEARGVLALLEAFPRLDRNSLFMGRRLALTVRMGGDGVRLVRDAAMARLRRRSMVQAEAEQVYGLSLERGPFKHRREVYDANVRAIRAYRTTRFDGSALILKATHSRGGLRDPDYGWNRLIAKTTIVEFATEHNAMLEPPVVEVVARTLSEAIDRVQERGKSAQT